MQIKDSVIWITGGTSGIGKGIAELMVEKGAKVVISGRNEEKGAEICEALGKNCVFIKCDVTDFEQIKAAAQAVVDRWGRMDVVCSFAGAPSVYPLFGPDGELNPNDGFRKDINVDLIGTYDTVRVAAYHIKKNEPNEFGERGCVILCSSLAAFSGSGNYLFGYKTAKEGVKALNRCFADAFAPFGIRCNAVMPGFILSGITTNPATNLGIDSAGDIPGQQFPTKIGKPYNIATTVAHMIENEFINRADFSVDAGHMSRY
ncbi:MAG: SDR family oxidoreductase [Mogibacterium sp.]|nr:SDR family oxidoreductase [Mogibacterium sp.]